MLAVRAGTVEAPDAGDPRRADPVMPSAPRRLPTPLLLAALTLTACVTGPEVEPDPARIARPTGRNVVLVEDSVVVFDASGSIERQVDFPQQKAVMRTFVSGMPPGTYRSALRVLGGREDDQFHLEPFDRYDLRDHANELRWMGRETPLAAILDEYAETLADRTGRAAFVIFTDGVPTRYGEYQGPEETLAAGRRLVARHGGVICLHTVQVGRDERGPALLDALAGLTDCGSSRHLDDLDGTDAIHAFHEQIYIGPPPPEKPKVRAMTDLDGDGVDDRFDRCAKTPVGARVDDRGCWVIEDYVFETDSARIRTEHESALQAVAAVLAGNPGLRIRLDGHTDDTGTADYNFQLARRRAGAVRDYLIAAGGIEEARIEQRSFGPTRPIAPNDTAEGRQRNRRVEISVIDW